MTILALILATLGGLAVATGAALAYMPAGVVILGAELMFAAYAIVYLRVRRREAP